MSYTTTACEHTHKRLDAAIRCASTAHPRWHKDFGKDILIYDKHGNVAEEVCINGRYVSVYLRDDH